MRIAPHAARVPVLDAHDLSFARRASLASLQFDRALASDSPPPDFPRRQASSDLAGCRHKPSFATGPSSFPQPASEWCASLPPRTSLGHRFVRSNCHRFLQALLRKPEFRRQLHVLLVLFPKLALPPWPAAPAFR